MFLIISRLYLTPAIRFGYCFSIDGVTESAYIITCPSAFRAARPMVCIRDVSERKIPLCRRLVLLQAKPREYQVPHVKGLFPRARQIRRDEDHELSPFSQLYRHRNAYNEPLYRVYPKLSQALSHFLVNVVTSTRSLRSIRIFISEIKSSI